MQYVKQCCSVIKCQNCEKILAYKHANKIKYKPCEIDTFVQTVDINTALMTFQCSDCGCILQVKT